METLRIHRWKWGAGMVVVLAGYLLIGVGLPQALQAAQRFDRWQQQRERLASAASWEAERIRLQTTRRQLQTRFKQLYVRLPDSDQMSGMLQVVQACAAEAGVAVHHLRPAERLTHPGYEALPLRVVLRGTFHEVGAFINRIEGSHYLMKVISLKMTALTVKGQEHGVLRAELLLHITTLKTQVKRSP